MRSGRFFGGFAPALHDRAGSERLSLQEAGSPSDAVLLARLRTGDARALAALIERYWSPLVAYAMRHTTSSDVAADIVQDVFVRLWERRASWRREGLVRGLLFRLTRNQSVSLLRRIRAHESAVRRFAEMERPRAATSASAENAELRTALEAAIQALPRRRREVFQLRMVDGLSYEEIAVVMRISRQTVANQLSRALTTLRRDLAHLID